MPNNSFRLHVLTPNGVYLNEEVIELYLNTSNGYIGVLKGMDTLICGVKTSPGFIKFINKTEYYAIFNGVLQIKNNEVYLLVSNIENANSIDLNRAKESLKRAQKRIEIKDSEIDLKRANASLKRALARINAVNKEFL